MARVRVKIFVPREVSNIREVYICADNISEVLNELFLRIGWRFREALCDIKTGTIRPEYNVLVNGVAIDLKRNPFKPLRDGDVIAIVSPIDGG